MLRAGFDHIGHIIGVAHRCGGMEEFVGMVGELHRWVYEVQSVADLLRVTLTNGYVRIAATNGDGCDG